MQPAIPAVDALFREWDRPDSPGCALGIVRDGALVYACGYGMANLEYAVPITPASIFHVASVSKQFTAICILALADEGKLALDDDIRRYLPEIPDYDQTITIRHLALHTSGLRDQWELLRLAGWREDDLITNGDVLAIAARQRALNFVPGTEWLYSNTGYTLMALIVERVSGQSLRAYADATFFQPLGMTHTHFHDDHTEIVPDRAFAYLPREEGGLRISIPVFDTVGATSLFITVEDLARWAVNIEERRVGGPLLAQMIVPGTLNDGTRLTYGLGLMIADSGYRGLPTIGHSGADAGYRSQFTCFPEQRCAVIVLCNLGSMSPGILARQVADIVLAEHFTVPLALETPPTEAVSLSANELSTWAGLYRDAATGAIRRITVDEGTLKVDIGISVALTPVARDRFTAVDTSIDVTLTRAEDGTRQLRESSPGGQAAIFVVVERAHPSLDQLGQYVGRYTSEELDVTYTIVVQDDALILKRRKFPDRPLLPTVADGFTDERAVHLAFTRDSEGIVTGFTVLTGRIRNLRFAKQQ